LIFSTYSSHASLYTVSLTGTEREGGKGGERRGNLHPLREGTIREGKGKKERTV